MPNRLDAGDRPLAETVVVTAAQMQQIESSLFAAGMPVAALMEKVAGQIAQWVIEHYPRDRASTVGCIVGPGHNGGDALVVARELHHCGYQVLLWCPFSKLKDLTAKQKTYADYLGIPFVPQVKALEHCDLIIDGGFGFGLTRPLEGDIADGIALINDWQIPVVSIDVPSGLETDSGEVLGIAIRAQQTLCLGLWKLGLLQDRALPWVGTTHLIPFDIPSQSIQTVLSDHPPLQRLTPSVALARLPLPRSAIAHKYKTGHALLIAGSLRYIGAILLTGKGAIASGVGMLTLVVPEKLKPAIASQLPEALMIGAPETAAGAIAALPDSVELEKYDVVGCGPGMTPEIDAVMKPLIASDRPLVLDADALNWLSQHDPVALLQQRSAPTVLTPHPGEFRRLFPQLWQDSSTPSVAAQHAAQVAQITLILKGATSAIAHLDGRIWLNTESTPALARGGSGDVLTGLITGLSAQLTQADPQDPEHLLSACLSAVWWHAQTGRFLADQRTVLGGAATQLADHLLPTLAQKLQDHRAI